MTLLLDTHTFLWFCQGGPLLSASAKTLIEDAGNRKLVSLASLLGDRHQSRFGKTQAWRAQRLLYSQCAITRTPREERGKRNRLLSVPLAATRDLTALLGEAGGLLRNANRV